MNVIGKAKEKRTFLEMKAQDLWQHLIHNVQTGKGDKENGR
jgi:hypothetical protein